MKGSLYRTFLWYMIVIVLITVVSIGALWVSSERSRFEGDKILLKEAYIHQQKEQLKREVDRALAFVNHMRSQTEERLKINIKNRVYEAHAIASNIYEQYKSSKSDEEIKKLIKDALRPIRFNGGRGYYFAFDLNGIETLFATRPDMEGKNMLDVRGGDGERVVFDMLNLVKKGGEEAYYSYTWHQPGTTGFHPKIAFVKVFSPLGWVIGTGEYVNDVEKDIQEECLTWITNITFGDGGYVFAGQYDGLGLTGPRTGHNMYDVEDVNGVKIVRELIQAARQGGGFVHYVLPKFEGKKHAPKLSYAAGIAQWQWYVGAGIYVDQIDQVLKDMETSLNQRIRNTIRNIAGVLLALTMAVACIIGFISRRIQKSMKSFMNFFDRAAYRSTKIDEASLHYKEFVNLARAANLMINERKRMEEDLHQARKMEAVGNLAGGIAHEFNNVLAIIIGNVELALDQPDLDPETFGCLEQIHSSGLRAKDVVQQLLNFSRKSLTEKQAVDIGETVREFLVLLKASLPAHISIRESLKAGGARIMADKTQIHQALINLCNNASQAMEADSGVLTIELNRIVLDDSRLNTLGGSQTGDYICLSIRDTGKGISQELIDKIFDPYFTTKETGKGTGLGLAVVDGIVKEHEGFIRVDSTPGKGTLFQIYLPTTDAEVSEPKQQAEVPRQEGKTLLFLDDELSITKMMSARLEKKGYTLIAETRPLDVLNRIKQDPFCCDMVISDLAMPQMYGDDLAKEILRIRPDLPIIICTGYTDSMTPEKAKAVGIQRVFTKPVEINELCNVIRNILDEPPHKSATGLPPGEPGFEKPAKPNGT